MSSREMERWRDELLRGPLGSEAVALVRREVGQDRELLQELEGEQVLSQLLARLPQVEVTPRFTAEVLAAVARAERPGDQHGRWAWWSVWFRMSPRLAGVGLALLLLSVALGYQQSKARSHMAASVADITRPVAEAAQAVRLPPVDILQDYEAIDRLRRTSALADVELLASFEAGSKP